MVRSDLNMNWKVVDVGKRCSPKLKSRQHAERCLVLPCFDY